MRLKQFGRVLLPPADGDQDFPIGARSALIPLENGSIDQDGNELILTSNTLTHRALVVDTSTLDSESPLFNLIKELGKGRNILYAELRDGSTLVTYAKLTKMGRVAEVKKYDAQQPINITFEQDYPYFMHADDGWFLDQGYTLDSGMVYDGHYIHYALTTTDFDFGIDNIGTSRISAGQLIISPRAASSFAHPVLTNFTNGEAFEFDDTINASEVLFVDFKTKTVALDGEAAFENVVTEERQNEWMGLELGVNSLQISATSITGTVDFYWKYKRTYL